MRKPVFGVSDQKQHVKPKKMARGFQFQIKEVEGLYYLGSEKNRSADQLGSYTTADQCLCF